MKRMNTGENIRDNFVLREVAGEYFLVPLGDMILQFGEIFSLNEVEIFFWKKIALGMSRKQVVDAVLEEYDVKRTIVEEDVSSFIDRLQLGKILI